MHRSTKTPAKLAVLMSAVIACGVSGQATAAPTLTSIYSFKGGADGASPVAGLTANAAQTVFYGTTPAGGGTGCARHVGCGTVFQLTPPAAGQTQWTETVLYSFAGKADGAAPMAGLAIDKNGVLYGTTSAGGSDGVGAVFTLTPPMAGQTNWTESVIYAFHNDGSDGTDPVAPVLIDQAGNLYGTTYTGGASNYGTAFRLSPPSSSQSNWTETQLYAFYLNPQQNGPGTSPTSGLIMDARGALYGTTSVAAGGRCGAAFQLTPGSSGSGPWTLTVLAIVFDASGICQLAGPLDMDSSGVLYGTSLGNFQGQYGGVYSLSPPAPGQSKWILTTLYDFDGPAGRGRFPYSGVVADSVGNFYGTTAGTSTALKPIVGATVFELTPPPLGQTLWPEKRLAVFDASTGSMPKSPLLKANDGTLYGTAQAGGTYNLGTVFALARPGK